MAEIIISIKPEYTKLIKTQNKVNEFRNFKTKRPLQKMWIYESAPSSSLKYIADVESPIEYPEQLQVIGDGDDRFNKGEMKYKYAYRIKHLYELKECIPLKRLKSEFGFTAPQGYCYVDGHKELVDYVLNEVGLVKLY